MSKTLQSTADRKYKYKKKTGLCLGIICLLFAVFSPARAGASGLPVKEVYIEGLYSLDKKELLYLLDIKRGGTLKPEALKRGIKRAFLKGIFEEISVETDDKETGLVRIKVKERDILKKIIIRGNRYLSGKFIKRHLDLKEDSVLRYDLLEKAREKLLQAINSKGFPSASLTLKAQRTKKPYRVNVVLTLDEGEPLFVSKIKIFGRPEDEVRPLMRLKTGDIYDRFRLEKDLDRLRKYYRNLGYLNPTVGPYTFKDGRFQLSVEPGRELSVRIKGNMLVNSRVLRRLMPFSEAADIRDDLIEEAVSKIAALYHSKGYPHVQIAPIVSEDNDKITLNFYIFEGKRVEVESVSLTGITIPEDRLKAIMSLRRGRVFNPDLIEPDMETVREFYGALGYVNTSVYEPQVVIEDSKAHINIQVKEGPRFEIVHIGIEGVKSVSGKEVFDAIEISAGEPYNEVDITDARRRVISLYRDYGFPRCRVDIIRRFDGTGASVVFKVDEGPKLLFGKTVVVGNRSTKLKVIQRELLHRESMPLDDALLTKARQRLYRRGIFTDVDVKVLNRYDGIVDIAVEVKEGRAGTVEFGFGYGEYEQYRGFFDIGHRNLFGLNRQISFRTELSSLESRYILNYHEPWFFDRPIPMRALLMSERRKEKNIDTGEIKYGVSRNTASVGFQKRLGERTRLDIFYEFSLTETFDVKSDVILSKEDTGTLAISSITPSLVYDTRDNPFDPQRGVFAGVFLKSASFLLFSETDFIKLTVHGSKYKRLARWLVLAVSLKGGVAKGLRDAEDLPLVERFFLGGRNTVRGFEQDFLGTPTGGNTFLLGNLELRMRIAKSWKVVGFLDTGNVWLRAEEIDPGKLRHTAGLGIRYNTPAGPLRLDYGQKLDRQAGESKGELHFSIGHAF